MDKNKSKETREELLKKVKAPKDAKELISDIYSDIWGAVNEGKKKAESLNPFGKNSPLGEEDPFSAAPSKDSSAPSKTPSNDLDFTPETFKDIHDALKEDISKNQPPKSEAQVQEQTKEEEKEPETDPMDDLNGLVGLKSIKKDVKELVNLVKVQKLRQDQGLKTVPVSLHLVFTGNPGTGKTTVARILGRLYKQIGVLKKGQLVETDRSALVAGYVGQTAMKTQAKIQEAMGGILFIDEAYTLVKEGGSDFGQEAIDTVLKAMEDHRDDLVVIVAGYTDLMKKFIDSNPGLKSRFNKYIEFPDYSAEELEEIFMGQCKRYEYQLDPQAEEEIKREIQQMEALKGDNFANARDVRNLFEAIITNQATRTAAIENITKEQLTTITLEDVLLDQKEAEEEQKKENPEEQNPAMPALEDQAQKEENPEEQVRKEQNPAIPASEDQAKKTEAPEEQNQKEQNQKEQNQEEQDDKDSNL